ncbi:rhamnogalacturonan acetylesterase [Fredinandcohnia sp. QZ13]|uniref:rhamnogalacturonan acetylesterase n=1 Tax=Fredinandcohnia sp. QZ13 TaxID=3073144 RepID=UPI002853592D|nr:rhamnogalacturonan acetylesterase [Fredinandcohnia sp. QZ13]MDR4887176.1 rhamnogalacturonan acetylesterase [Fredinandcohnia sp. QZ13]
MKNIHIYIAGDSTVSDCPPNEEPRAGWGQVLHHYFLDNVIVHNLAIGGRSSKSYIDEKRLETILNEIQPNDYLFIQFGHNDQKQDQRRTEPYSSYQSYLTQYIRGAREKKAIPVLITSMHRRTFDENGKITNSLGEYPRAMMALAKEQQVDLIDLWNESKQLYESLGPEKCKDLFIWFEPGEHPNYPDGISDDTHFRVEGAYKFASIIAKKVKEGILGLAKYVK